MVPSKYHLIFLIGYIIKFVSILVTFVSGKGHSENTNESRMPSISGWQKWQGLSFNFDTKAMRHYLASHLPSPSVQSIIGKCSSLEQK